MESEVQGRQTSAVTNAQTDVADKDRWCQSLQPHRNKEWEGGSRKLFQHVARHLWQSQSFILWSPKSWVLISRNTHIQSHTQTNIYWFLSVGGHCALAVFGQLLFFCLKFLFWLFVSIVNSNNSFVLFFFLHLLKLFQSFSVPLVHLMQPHTCAIKWRLKNFFFSWQNCSRWYLWDFKSFIVTSMAQLVLDFWGRCRKLYLGVFFKHKHIF